MCKRAIAVWNEFNPKQNQIDPNCFERTLIDCNLNANLHLKDANFTIDGVRSWQWNSPEASEKKNNNVFAFRCDTIGFNCLIVNRQKIITLGK